jgi:hypothetical protein
LFTVPDGPAELDFNVIVRNATGQALTASQTTKMAVVGDAGAVVSGNVTPGREGVALSLAAGGLTAEFFHLGQPVTGLPALDGMQPVRTGYVTAINEPNPQAVFGDDPLGAHLGSDYAIRFSGEIRADAGAGQFRFWLTCRNRAAVLIDGKTVGDTGLVAGTPAETAFSVALTRGWHSIEVIYYLALGTPSLRLEWQPPWGRRAVLGPENLRTTLAGMTAVSAADGTFAFPQVPSKFDSVWIRAEKGIGFEEFQPVKPGAGPVSIAVPK